LRIYLQDASHQKQFLSQIAKKIGVKNYEDWYNVTVQNVLDHGGSPLMQRYNKSLRQGIDSIRFIY
jgi:hypothetical protein